MGPGQTKAARQWTEKSSPYEKLVLEREGGVLWDGSPPGFQVMEPG